MMEVYRADGHLHDRALLALIREEPMTQLERLELAEHLSYCDRCLQRYTQLLLDVDLAVPAHSCRDTLWTRIRLRAVHLFSQRYATAAAAVALSLGVLWGSGYSAFDQIQTPQPDPYPTYSQFWQSQWSDRVDGVLDHLSGLLRRIDPFPSPLEERYHQTSIVPKEDYL